MVPSCTQDNININTSTNATIKCCSIGATSTQACPPLAHALCPHPLLPGAFRTWPTQPGQRLAWVTPRNIRVVTHSRQAFDTEQLFRLWKRPGSKQCLMRTMFTFKHGAFINFLFFTHRQFSIDNIRYSCELEHQCITPLLSYLFVSAPPN